MEGIVFADDVSLLSPESRLALSIEFQGTKKKVFLGGEGGDGNHQSSSPPVPARAELLDLITYLGGTSIILDSGGPRLVSSKCSGRCLGLYPCTSLLGEFSRDYKELRTAKPHMTTSAMAIASLSTATPPPISRYEVRVLTIARAITRKIQQDSIVLLAVFPMASSSV